MSSERPSRLRFNFGFLIEARAGTSREIELDYPTVQAVDMELSPLQGKFTATRTSEGVYLQGLLYSTQTAQCVRCLTDALLPITIEIDDLLYYPYTPSIPEGELYIPENGSVDLAPLIRECAVLGIPIQPVCREDCQGLCVDCGQNLNEADCGCDPEPIDPRMAALQQLLKNNES